jgi:hypothetical protein
MSADTVIALCYGSISLAVILSTILSDLWSLVRDLQIATLGDPMIPLAIGIGGAYATGIVALIPILTTGSSDLDRWLSDVPTFCLPPDVDFGLPVDDPSVLSTSDYTPIAALVAVDDTAVLLTPSAPIVRPSLPWDLLPQPLDSAYVAFPAADRTLASAVTPSAAPAVAVADLESSAHPTIIPCDHSGDSIDSDPELLWAVIDDAGRIVHRAATRSLARQWRIASGAIGRVVRADTI